MNSVRGKVAFISLLKLRLQCFLNSSIVKIVDKLLINCNYCFLSLIFSRVLSTERNGYWGSISTPKKISSEFCTNLILLKSQRIRCNFIAQIKANFVWRSVCQNSKANIPNSFQSHTKKAHHSACEKRTAPVLSRYGQVGLTMYSNTLHSATSVQSGAFLVRHWNCAYSIRNFVRISYTHLLFWDTILSYYNRMILSKNGKSFIPIPSEPAER